MVLDADLNILEGVSQESEPCEKNNKPANEQRIQYSFAVSLLLFAGNNIVLILGPISLTRLLRSLTG